MPREILIVITMDCERPRSQTRATASGPPDYESSARYIEAYGALAAKQGWPVTYFLHPEVCAPHRTLFENLALDGACLGLHLHPWKFDPLVYKAHFGGLTAELQRNILGEAIEIFSDVFGSQPDYFRPGTFSANDSTFPVLAELGFRGGSISVPDRVYRELCAVWTGAPRDPHRGHDAFRLLAGELPFVNMPLSIDTSETVEANGRRFFRDLRPDYETADYDAIAHNIVGQVLARTPAVPVVNLVTHNDNDYSDPTDRVCGNFVRVLESINRACEANGVTPVGATLETVVDRVLAIREAAVPFETVGVIHGSRGETVKTGARSHD